MAKIYSVGQVNNYIRNMFDTDFVLNRISVIGEVSNCKYHTSGHIYFTIKDNANALSAVMFAGSRGGLSFRLEDGMKIVATGNITVYERDGKYQLYAKKIEHAGMGELYERYLALKKELEEMGMFDAMYKQPVPRYVKTLGVVTASTGAAIHDIINVSTRRNPYIQIVLYPAQVQGEGAAESICRGIRRLDGYGVDVIIAGRGGGSIEDLWAFNDERVARTIFECRTPVISAVGHETDFTIADFVADMRAPTPSAAAELAVCDIKEMFDKISGYKDELDRRLEVRLEELRSRLSVYSLKLKALSPSGIINGKKQHLDQLWERLDRAVSELLKERRNSLAVKSTKLEALSPLSKLSLGYSYVTDNDGKTLTSVKQAGIGQRLNINVKDGIIYADVTGSESVLR